MKLSREYVINGGRKNGGKGGGGRETGTIDSPVLWPTIIHGWILLTATNATGQASNLLGGSLDPATKPRRLTATTTQTPPFRMWITDRDECQLQTPRRSNLLIDAFIAINVSFTGLCPRVKGFWTFAFGKLLFV